MRIRVFFAWYDLWVGAYWSQQSRTLYLCPLPMLVVSVRFGEGRVATKAARGEPTLFGEDA